MKNLLLFVYGTIGDPEFFECLLKRKPDYQDGQLCHFGLFVHPESGYLFVKPKNRSTVNGKLVEITEEELKVLDLWEDVPFYEREVVSIECNRGTQRAFVYTQNNAEGISVDKGALRSRTSMLEDIQAFRKWIDEQN